MYNIQFNIFKKIIENITNDKILGGEFTRFEFENECELNVSLHIF